MELCNGSIINSNQMIEPYIFRKVGACTPKYTHFAKYSVRDGGEGGGGGRLWLHFENRRVVFVTFLSFFREKYNSPSKKGGSDDLPDPPPPLYLRQCLIMPVVYFLYG